MPYIEVYVDTDDVLKDISDEDLKSEINSRQSKSDKGIGAGPNWSIPQRVAKYTLEEAADIFRKQGRYDLAFKLEEIRTDFVMN